MATNNSINSSTNQYLPLAGGTMAGAVDMGSHQINSVTDPTSAQDAATKNYVDSVAAGLNPKEAVAAATTANLVGTYVNGVSGIGATFTMTATGVQTIDGQTVTINYNYLLKNQSSGFQNGVYTCTTAGAGGVASIFTRATNYNTASDMNAGDLIPVISGTANANTAWLQSATITTVGTDNLVFTQFGATSPLTTKGDLYGYDTAGNRFPVGSDFQQPKADSTASLGLSYDWPYIYPSKRTTFFTDFTPSIANTAYEVYGSLVLAGELSGTGAGINSDFTVSGHPGVIQTTTGTTTTGNAGFFCFNDSNGIVKITDGQTVIETSILISANLSDGTNRYTIGFGLNDNFSTTAAPSSNGIMMQYSDNINSGQWNGITKASGTSTNVNSSTTVAINTWYNLRIVINAAATSVTFYVNGTSIGSSSTNIPTDSHSYYYFIGIIKALGTTARTCNWDYLLIQKDFTTAR